MTGLTRRAFLRAGVCGAGVACLKVGVENLAPHIELTRESLATQSHSTKTTKLLHLSDIHFSHAVPFALVEEAIDLGLSGSPDFACITGDFVTARFENYERCVATLRRLSGAVPTYATLGNHDGGTWAGRAGGYRTTQEVRRLLADSNIELLDNQSRLTQSGVRLVGVGDLWSGEFNPATAFKDVVNGSDDMVVLLSHNPDSKDQLRRYPWHLMLSGHTHGGQIVLPLLNVAPIAPIGDYRFLAGMNQWGQRCIHTSRGVGSILGIRINCPPHATIIELPV